MIREVDRILLQLNKNKLDQIQDQYMKMMIQSVGFMHSLVQVTIL